MKRMVMPRSSLVLFLFGYAERWFSKLGLAQSTDRSTVFYSIMPKYAEIKAAVSERILRRNLSRDPKAYKCTSRGSGEDRIKNFN